MKGDSGFEGSMLKVEGSEPSTFNLQSSTPRPLGAERIDMTHGAGGTATHRLIQRLFLPRLENPALAPLGDAALLTWNGGTLALTTDAFVVRPLVFPGGSIGELAVNGTVND